MLPNDAVLEYQRIYKELYGNEISVEQALEEGNKLLNLILVIEGKEMKYEKKLHNSSKRAN